MLGQKVWDLATKRFKDVSATQYEKGWQKYKTVLTTFNGRNAFQDAREEVVDMHQYLTQAEMEFEMLAKVLYYYAVTEGFLYSLPAPLRERLEAVVKDENVSTLLPKE